jgi:hypothetical protein
MSSIVYKGKRVIAGGTGGGTGGGSGGGSFGSLFYTTLINSQGSAFVNIAAFQLTPNAVEASLINSQGSAFVNIPAFRLSPNAIAATPASRGF